jgi:Transposase DDE domain group 1
VRALPDTGDFICKWNPRKQDKAAWIAKAETAGAWVETRPGKRTALLSLTVERAMGTIRRPFRLIVRVTERTIDRHGQYLLMPAIELEGWWTSLTDEATTVIELYKHHALHEQYHSEFKTDLDLERLPSGKFDTNDALLQLAAFAYNCLRLVGQLGLTGEIAPIRHPAKRRRIRTVLQEIMYRAAKVVSHARRLVLPSSTVRGQNWAISDSGRSLFQSVRLMDSQKPVVAR